MRDQVVGGPISRQNQATPKVSRAGSDSTKTNLRQVELFKIEIIV